MRRSASVLFALIILGLAAVPMIPVSVSAEESSPEIRLSPESGPVGTTVTIHGSNAPPHADVMVLWVTWPAAEPCEPPPMGAGLVDEVVADENGNFTATHQLDIETSGPDFDLQGATYFAKSNEQQSEFVCFTFAEGEEDPQVRYFPETGHVVGHGFLDYWEQFGGLEAFGHPVSTEFRDPETGVVVQYFERAKFEWHPGTWPERHDVVVEWIGAEAFTTDRGVRLEA